jgi:Uma2 family endonuclease
MIPVIAEKYLSVDEFWALLQTPEFQGKRVELVDGKLVFKQGLDGMAGGTGGEHGEITGDLSAWMWNHVRQHKLGRLTAAETCYVLWQNPDKSGKDIVRCPDIGFVRLDRAPQPFGEGYVPMPPDLAVEVMSPGNITEDMERKIQDYLRYGVQIVWQVFPKTQTIVVHTPEDVKTLTIEDTLDGGTVLPGFKLKVSEIFPA